MMPAALRTAKPATTPPPLSLSQVPQHVGIIMDGNGRWATLRSLPRLAGHRAGTENIRRVIERFADYGVRYLTLFAFSTENWNRPRREVLGLMTILSHYLKRETRKLHKNGIRLTHIGLLEGLNPKLQQRVLDAIELTKDNTRMTVCVAFNYGGRAEIVKAVRRIVSDGVPVDLIDDALIESYLYTARTPDPDLIIRTAGEMRLSNFLLWQGAYAECISVPEYWPDFDIRHIDEALLAYSRRRRSFGGLPPDEPEDSVATNGRNGGSVAQTQGHLVNGSRAQGNNSQHP